MDRTDLSRTVNGGDLKKKKRSHTNGVGRVSDNDVKAVDLVLEESKSIADVDLDLGVLETSSHAWQVLLGHANDGLYHITSQVCH